MSHLSEQILQTVEALSAEDQQQVLDFVEFLQAKRQQLRATQSENAPKSFFEVAQSAIGAGEGPGDLSTLQAMSTQFWQGNTLGQLISTQSPTTVHNIDDLVADFWPEEDSVDDFLNFLKQQRQETV